MHEWELLSQIYARSSDLETTFPHVLVGPGDDCAVVRVPAPTLLLKTDQVIEGRHFVPAAPLDLVARKALARSISDIAAMAGTPLVTLAACALPRGFDQGRANELFEACSQWARAFGAPLVGGDIASFGSPEAPLTLTITSVGTPHPRRGPVLRSGAHPGDHLYVTGAIGGAFDQGTGMGRHMTFQPRVAEARWLADTLGGALHAMMDVSDGLGIDARRMSEASRVELDLESAAIPLAPEARADHGRAALLRAVSDGEDYELLFAADPSAHVPPHCPITGTPVTRIGTCGQPGQGAYLRFGPERVDISRRGWEHQ